MMLYRSLGHLDLGGYFFGRTVFEAVKAENGLGFFGEMTQARFDAAHQFAHVQLIFSGRNRVGIPDKCVGEVFFVYHRRFEMIDTRVFDRRDEIGFQVVDLQKAAAFPQPEEHVLDDAFDGLTVVDLAEREQVHFFPVTLVNLPECQAVVVPQGFDEVLVR